MAEYLSRELGVKASIRPASDYAGVIEAMKAKKLELAWFGPASYAMAWLVTNGQVVPLATHTGAEGVVGFCSVIAVRADSPYMSLADVKGKKLALADPNSTSGNQAPRFFLAKQGVDVDKHFASATFSGSHEMSIMGLVNGTFDAAATSWYSDEFSHIARMESKGMIPPNSTRIIWKSPLLPNDPWVMPAWLPEAMRAEVKKALLDMPAKDPEALGNLFEGKAKNMVGVKHEDYVPVVDMIESNLEQRKGS